MAKQAQNYERYKSWTAESYEKQGIMTYLCRMPADRKILPVLSRIKDKSVLDVGLGTGDYTRLLIDDNRIVGVDQNPHLCRLNVKVHKGDATQLSTLVGGEKFDIVLSTWMTDYLNDEKLQSFFCEAKKVLKEDGQLLTTTIRPNGWGLVYLVLARYWRGTDKHACAKKRVADMLKNAGFNDIEILNLNSWLGIPWACLVIAK
ncbi:MAG: class I SAM-dependent methyltransferase [Sedimentisphaerales bacterium]|nr:class I SAM-dependent methyltransferase [Sedimentisphaerales bacterium]